MINSVVAIIIFFHRKPVAQFKANATDLDHTHVEVASAMGNNFSWRMIFATVIAAGPRVVLPIHVQIKEM